MVSIKQLQISRGSKGTPLALLLLILLPFPVSIPLVLWLTGRDGPPDSPRGPLAPSDHNP